MGMWGPPRTQGAGLVLEYLKDGPLAYRMESLECPQERQARKGLGVTQRLQAFVVHMITKPP